VGHSLEESGLADRFQLRVLGVFRGKRRILADPEVDLRAGDVLLVRGDIERLLESVGFKGLRLNPAHRLKGPDIDSRDLILVEAMVAPRSWLTGRTVKELDFRWRYRAIVVAIQRKGGLIHRKLADVPLRLGDTLLLQIQRHDLDRLRRERNLMVLGPSVPQPYRPEKMWIALAALAGVILLNALGVLPIAVSALLGVGLMVVTRCLRYEDMYRAVDWQVVLLLAGMFSLGVAFQKTGLASGIAAATISLFDGAGDLGVLAGFYLITLVLTAGMSNAGSALIMAPIALVAAEKVAADPRPFLIVIALAASADFLTPVGYQTNTMVYGPGAYRFGDYTKVGLPLSALFFVITMLLVPRLWPL
jgi:di/tricarboxylate transporter